MWRRLWRWLLAEPGSGSDHDQAVLREARRQTKWAQRGAIIGGLSLALTSGVLVVSHWRFDADRAKEPITIVAGVESACRVSWFTPHAPEEIDFEELDDVSTPDWSQVLDAAPADQMLAYATIQGRSGAEVLLTGIEVEVLDRKPPPRGTVLTSPCGDQGAPRWMSVDLDQDPPLVSPGYDPEALDQDDAAEIRRPIEFPYEVSVDDLETFEIHASTQTCDCTWVARVHWRSEGRAGTTVIDNDGKPFRTVSTGNAIASCNGSGECS